MRFQFHDKNSNIDICNFELNCNNITSDNYIILPHRLDDNGLIVNENTTYFINNTCVDIPNNLIWVYVTELDEYHNSK